MSPEMQHLVLAALEGLVVTTVFVLVLFVGFSVVFNFPKLRSSGGRSLVVRNLEEKLGHTAHYLAPTAPRGPADQLHSPELIEAAARRST